MNTISNTCKSYFHAFQDLDNNHSPSSKSLTILKIISYFTLIAPLIMGITYGIAQLMGRVKKVPPHPDMEARIEKATARSLALDHLDLNKDVIEERNSIDNHHPPLVEQEQEVIDDMPQEVAGSRTREDWVREAKDLGLDLCGCMHADIKHGRLKMETTIIETALKAFPAEETPTLTILSFACGDLLQDYLLLQSLAKNGYKDIHLDLVDPATSKKKLQTLQNLIKNKMLGVNVNINLYSYINKVPARVYDFASGIDLDIIANEHAKSTWLDLAHVLSKINEKGFCYLQKDGFKLLYDFNSLNADMIKTDPYRIAFVSPSFNSDSFFSFVFCRLFELKLTGESKIDIYFFSNLGSVCNFDKINYNQVNKFINEFNKIFDLNLQINLKTISCSAEQLMEYNFDLIHINFKDLEQENYLKIISNHCKLLELFVNNDVQFEIYKKHQNPNPYNYYRSLATTYNIPIRVQKNHKMDDVIYTP